MHKLLRLACSAFTLGGIGLASMGFAPAIAPGTIPIGITSGSLQNPCWSPAGDQIAFTHFLTSYNTGTSEIIVVNADGSGTPKAITGNKAANVNLPGSCWNAAANGIVYSSDIKDDRDEVWMVPPVGGSATRITNRPGARAWEPSFSPDGQWIVFESHGLSGTDPGTLWKVMRDGSNLTQLTISTNGIDDREPNWSPAGDRIVFQSNRNAANTGKKNDIDIWTIDVNGGSFKQITTASGEDTDASFSPDGQRIVYSSDNGGRLDFSDLFVISAQGGQATQVHAAAQGSYAGAPSWSPDGRWIAFETTTGDPDSSPGAKLAIVAAP